VVVYFGAPVEGEGVSDGEMGPWGSGMHSRSRSLWQQIEAASGSRAMISCLGLCGETRPAWQVAHGIQVYKEQMRKCLELSNTFTTATVTWWFELMTSENCLYLQRKNGYMNAFFKAED